jgi:hypothetical protein
MPFEKSLPFKEDSIAKIAPAFDLTNSSLIVAPKDEMRIEYEIWGVMFYRSHRSRFTESSFVFTDFNYFRPDVITVTATSPGSLLISREDSIVGRFINGNFERSTLSPIGYALVPYLLDAIKSHEGFRKFQNKYWLFYREALLYLLFQAAKRGHGGTIVLLPSNKIKQYENVIVSKYVLKESFKLSELIVKVLSLRSGDIAASAELNKIFAERLDFLAQLSCIDGALIMTTDLDILSFGSTLNAPKWNGSIIRGSNGLGSDEFGTGGEAIDVSKLGTKHNSAVNFAGACPDSIVFVISQDGPVRLILRKNEEKIILYWPDCLTSMFIERT